MALRKAEEGEAVELVGCEEAEDVHGITGGLAYVVKIQHGCGTAPRVVGGQRLISQPKRGGTRLELDETRDDCDDLEDPRVRLVKF